MPHKNPKKYMIVIVINSAKISITKVTIKIKILCGINKKCVWKNVNKVLSDKAFLKVSAGNPFLYFIYCVCYVI